MATSWLCCQRFAKLVTQVARICECDSIENMAAMTVLKEARSHFDRRRIFATGNKASEHWRWGLRLPQVI